MEVEGNIPYVTRGRAEACVGEEVASGADDEGDACGPTRLRDRSGAFVRKLDDDLISKDDLQTCVNIGNVRDETLRVNTDVAPPNDVGDHVAETDEFEALAPVDDSERDGDHISAKDRRTYLYAGDLDPVYSRDFTDAIDEALILRHLAARKPKLDSCDTCRRA
jgi:hypothetical protein